MTTGWRATDPGRLAADLAEWLAATPGRVRVAVDGAPACAPEKLALDVAAQLPARGRPAAVVRADLFWRDASLRLEHGREDVESYLHWLDADTLRREVLEPVGRGAPYLPSLRDPVTDRSTREAARRSEPGLVLLVAGGFLLGRDLPFDRTIHLTLPPAALAARTPVERSWTLPAYARYDTVTAPGDRADVIVKADREHPVIRGLPRN